LPELEIAYHTFGALNKDKSNVVWVCHALTANSDPVIWWQGLFGKGCYFDPKKYYIVCANILGSCYGTTGPVSIDPSTNQPYYLSFPLITIRDMVKAQILLRKHLGIDTIHICIGGSLGGHQILEWAIMEAGVIANMILLATTARESAWSIAIHTTQRMAVATDPSWGERRNDAAVKGLKTARGIGLLSYRSREAYIKTQTDNDDKVEDFRASSYIKYQGDKLVNRNFNAYSYWYLTKSMDTHHIGRGRGKIEDVLQRINTNTLIIGITSDILVPLEEQIHLTENIPGAVLKKIHSDFGHDGFLVNTRQIANCIGEFFHAERVY